jgi:hypothetical protein
MCAALNGDHRDVLLVGRVTTLHLLWWEMHDSMLLMVLLLLRHSSWKVSGR